MSIRKLFKDSLIYGVCNTFTKVFLMLLVPIYTRILTLEEFGGFNLLLASINILAIIFGLQIESGTARMFYEAKDLGEERQLVATAFWSLWLLPLLGSCGIILCRKPIALLLFNQTQHEDWPIFMALIIPLWVQFFHILLIFRLRDEKGHFFSFSLLNLGSAATVAILLVWKYGWGVKGILVGQITGLSLGLAGSIWTLRHYLKPPLSCRWLKQCLFYGVPLVPAVAANWGHSQANRFLIAGFLGLSSLGLFSLAVNVAGIITFVQSAFTLAWQPHSCWMMQQKDCDNFFRRILNTYVWVMGILFLGLTLYSGELVSLFAPPVYYDSARYLGFIGAAVVLTGCNQILAIGNCMVKKTYYNNIGTLAGTTCNLLGLYLTISIFGIAAAACWLALGALSSNILNFWTSQRNHRIPYNYGRFGFFVLFLACVALWNLTSTVSTLISPSHILIKAMVLVFGILALGYSLLDRLDRQKGLKMLLVRFGY